MVVVQSQTKQPEAAQAKVQPKPLDISKLKFDTNQVQTPSKKWTQPAKPASKQPATSHPAMNPAAAEAAKAATPRKTSNNSSAKLDPDVDEIIRQVEQSYNAKKTAGAKTGPEAKEPSSAAQQQEADQKVNAIIDQLKAQKGSSSQKPAEGVSPKGGGQNGNESLEPQNVKYSEHTKIIDFGNTSPKGEPKDTGTLITNLPKTSKKK